MLKDITLGQFFPGTSIVHRLDPRCKLLMTVVYIAALFTAENYVSYAAMLVVTGVCIALSRIPLKVIHITDKASAQNVPAPVTTYALFRDGQFLTQSIQSDKKFLALAGL